VIIQKSVVERKQNKLTEAMEAGEELRDRRRLVDLIEEATVSPEKSLDLGLLQSVKALVRSSDANVLTAFDTLFDKLKKNHSQVWNFIFGLFLWYLCGIAELGFKSYFLSKEQSDDPRDDLPCLVVKSIKLR